MKTSSYFFILPFLLISCTLGITPSNYSSNFYDEFKGKNTSILKQELYAKESNSNIGSISIELIMYDDTTKNDIQVFITMIRNLPIENQLYIKSDDKEIYKIPIELIDSKYKESNITETTITQKFDTTGVSHTESSTSNNLISYNSASYKAIIPFEIAEKLKTSHAITWRLYSGALPSTFVLKNRNMEKFNCFINQEINQ